MDRATGEVERVERPSQADFERYASANAPVLITGVVSSWPAVSRWTPEYLRSVAGDRVLPVARMQSGSYSQHTREPMMFGAYLDAVAAPTPDGSERLYLSELQIEKHLRELVADFEVPTYIRDKSPVAATYIGKDVDSQTHFHPHGGALLCVVSGRKRVRLYAPDQTPHLYRKDNFSAINPLPVDLTRFPKYDGVKYRDVVVGAGEMLFIPIFWWHGVYTDGFSTAVTFFWDDPPAARWITPRGFPWYMAPVYQAVRRVKWVRWVNTALWKLTAGGRRQAKSPRA